MALLDAINTLSLWPMLRLFEKLYFRAPDI